MRPVVVLIFHLPASSGSGPLVRALATTRRAMADRLGAAFLAAGADSAEVLEVQPDGRPFGERLAAEVRARSAAGSGAPGGLIVLGSGSIPLAPPIDLRHFVDAAAGPPGYALANNRYSADVIAVSRAADLADLPPLPADNALPRWLEERAGVTVSDLRTRWRLGVDIDSPLDLILIGQTTHGTAPLLAERLMGLAAVLRDRRAELLVAGRISATTLHWLETGVECRVRALVEERGLRAASSLAQSADTTGAEATGRGANPANPPNLANPPNPANTANSATASPLSRPPTSILGQLLDRDGPEALARIVATLGDAAVVDTRVLLAHRYGPDESSWPSAEDRFASDLLLTPSIADPWLRALTESACESPIPILLGGHTALNGGLRLLAQRAGPGEP